MLGLKDKLLGRKHHDLDYRDVRSHVLSDSLRPAPAQQTIGEKYQLSPQPTMQRPAPRRGAFDDFADPQEQALAQPDFDQPLGNRPDPRDFAEPSRGGGRQNRGSDYDLLDRLSLIESQLSAIRSQTETINERLKNLETRLIGRRY